MQSSCPGSRDLNRSGKGLKTANSIQERMDNLRDSYDDKIKIHKL
jgi:hypothetical protein